MTHGLSIWFGPLHVPRWRQLLQHRGSHLGKLRQGAAPGRLPGVGGPGGRRGKRGGAAGTPPRKLGVRVRVQRPLLLRAQCPGWGDGRPRGPGRPQSRPGPQGAQDRDRGRRRLRQDVSAHGALPGRLPRGGCHSRRAPRGGGGPARRPPTSPAPPRSATPPPCSRSTRPP